MPAWLSLRQGRSPPSSICSEATPAESINGENLECCDHPDGFDLDGLLLDPKAEELIRVNPFPKLPSAKRPNTIYSWQAPPPPPRRARSSAANIPSAPAAPMPDRPLHRGAVRHRRRQHSLPPGQRKRFNARQAAADRHAESEQAFWGVWRPAFDQNQPRAAQPNAPRPGIGIARRRVDLASSSRSELPAALSGQDVNLPNDSSAPTQVTLQRWTQVAARTPLQWDLLRWYHRNDP